MTDVYILRSIETPDQRYIGITEDLRRRVKEQNGGLSKHTAKFRPWRVETYVGFSDQRRAREFERYLKTEAGWAFSLKRL